MEKVLDRFSTGSRQVLDRFSTSAGEVKTDPCVSVVFEGGDKGVF
jgi:hypothetical protein